MSSFQPVGYVILAPGQLAAPSPLLADNIDPNSHDLASLFNSIDPIDAQVILALKLERGSGPAIVHDGIKLSDIKKMDDSAQDQIKSRVRQALNRLITNGDILLKGVVFDDDTNARTWDPGSQFGQYRVRFVNLRAHDNRVREAPVRFAAAMESS